MSSFVMPSIAALGIDRPQRRSVTTARQANLVHPTFEKRRTAALDLTEFLRFFAKKAFSLAAVLSNDKIIS